MALSTPLLPPPAAAKRTTQHAWLPRSARPAAYVALALQTRSLLPATTRLASLAWASRDRRHGLLLRAAGSLGYTTKTSQQHARTHSRCRGVSQ